MEKTSKQRLFRQFHQGLLPTVTVGLIGLILSACNTELAPPELAAEDVFAETGNVDSLYIDLNGLDNTLVCYGSDAAIAADGESCDSGDEANGEIMLQACTEQGIKISYIGNNGSPAVLSANFNTNNISFDDCDTDAMVLFGFPMLFE